ncbi:MAG: glucose 1-dehydrogenase [Candidatus Rokubacteria bacterium]|nr:glucose 1-dehydrogenase [Candidatus Rokubacteria bacterium]
MTGRLAGRTALVTGSTKGIGLAIARAFAREGARVAINARRAEDCDGVAKAVGGVAVPADLSRPNEVRRLAREATAALGGTVDILVNNAGQPRVAPAAELAEADYRTTLELNLNAAFLLSQEIGRGMLGSRRGVIINVSSINGTVPFPQRLAYCVSKAGLNMLTRVMAIEWAASGVRVNAIAPGYVETEIVKGLSARGILDRAVLARRTPLGRLGDPDEIAAVAVFLASDEASYITGEVVTADGGWSAYGYV